MIFGNKNPNKTRIDTWDQDSTKLRVAQTFTPFNDSIVSAYVTETYNTLSTLIWPCNLIYVLIYVTIGYNWIIFIFYFFFRNSLKAK